MEKELGELREKVNSVENKRKPFNDQGETECLEVVKKEEERKYLELVQEEVTLYSKVFTTPSSPSNPSLPLMWASFSSSSCSASQASWCSSAKASMAAIWCWKGSGRSWVYHGLRKQGTFSAGRSSWPWWRLTVGPGWKWWIRLKKHGRVSHYRIWGGVCVELVFVMEMV